ncbi:MAG: hypothetical protein ACK5MA_02170 [Parachlamydiaceae bacterium]
MQVTQHINSSHISGWLPLSEQEPGKSLAVHLTGSNGSIQTFVNQDPKDEKYGLFKKQFRESVKVLHIASGTVNKSTLSKESQRDFVWVSLGLQELFKTCLSKSMRELSAQEQREVSETLTRQLGQLDEAYLDRHLRSWTHWIDQSVPIMGPVLHTLWNGKLTSWDQFLPSDQDELKTVWRLARVIKAIH